MAPYPAGELNQRTDGRRFDDGPVVVVVATNLGHRAGQGDEQLIRLVVPVQHGANFRLLEQAGVAFFALEQAIQPFFNSGAHQQWMAGVIDAEVDTLVRAGTQPQQLPGGGDDVPDVSHADQAAAQTFAGCRIRNMMIFVQFGRGIPQNTGPGGIDFFPWRRGRNSHRLNPCAAFLLLPCQLVQAFFHERVMVGGKGFGVGTVLSRAAEFIEPGAHRVDCPARLAPVLLKDASAGAPGIIQALYQRGWQGGRRQQDITAQHPDPVNQTGQCRQVIQIEVIGFVQHQVGCQQAQHRRDLMPTTGALGGGHQVVNGADEDRGCQEFLRVRGFFQPLGQWPVFQAAFVVDKAVVVEQVFQGFAASVSGLRDFIRLTLLRV